MRYLVTAKVKEGKDDALQCAIEDDISNVCINKKGAIPHCIYNGIIHERGRFRLHSGKIGTGEIAAFDMAF